MATALLDRIKPIYSNGKARPRICKAGTNPGAGELPDLSRHLLRDIGLFDGPESRAEPPRSARDLLDRYR